MAEPQLLGTEAVLFKEALLFQAGSAAKPYNTFHQFGFYMFETSLPFSDDRLDEIGQSFTTRNQLVGNAAYTVKHVATLLVSILELSDVGERDNELLLSGAHEEARGCVSSNCGRIV